MQGCIRKTLICLLWVLLPLPVAKSQEQGIFQWKAGQTLRYKVEHVTEVQEKTTDSTNEFKNRLELERKWKVDQVSPAGIATLTLTIPFIKMETVSPKGDTLRFDSSKPEEGSKELRTQLEKYTQNTIAIILVDSQGRVRGVKESKFGSASVYEAELPFAIVVPEGKITKDLAWERPYQITLDPPQGTGEKFEAKQRYECQKVDSQLATITFNTQLKAPPANTIDWIPLLPFQTDGEAIFDTQLGVLRQAILKTDKTLKNHQGEGSSYRFFSIFKESLVESK